MTRQHRRYGVGEPVVVGSGLSTGGVVLCDPLGAGDAVGATEPLGVADGLTDGDRDGDRDGLGDVSAGLGDEVADELGWVLGRVLAWPVAADSDFGIGRTRMYSARMARNRPEMTRVEVRARPLTRHLRWPGRCRDRRRR
jgi:hypothetical protein